MAMEEPVSITIVYRGQHKLLEISPNWNVLFLKQMSCLLFNVSHEDHELLFACQIMVESSRCHDWHFRPGNFVHLINVNKDYLPAKGYPPPEVSPFFVYCSICESLQDAKIHVRCNLCKLSEFNITTLGTITTRDIEYNRITGKCLSWTGCSSLNPEFYFLCMNHPLDINPIEEEWSSKQIVLSHVERNFDSVDCSVCFDSKEMVIHFWCNSQVPHVMCLPCFRYYAESSLANRTFYMSPEHGYTLCCPSGCLDSVITDPHTFYLLGKEFYERYKALATEQFVLTRQGLHCPNPLCGMPWLSAPQGTTRRFICSGNRLQGDGIGCGWELCSDCGSVYHGEESDCATVSANEILLPTNQLAEASSQPVDSRVTAQFGRQCPGCRARTVKNGGCNHMTCSRCCMEWCWICNIPWSEDCRNSHWLDII